jgi:TnpA family transposase
MPGQFLTDPERERLTRFPEEIPPADLTAYFTLSLADREAVRAHRGAANRLGYALQLGAVRYLGFAPADLTTAPPAAVAWLAQQLGESAAALAEYTRAHTRTDHLREVQAYLGFRDAGAAEIESLAGWLRARALEHDKPTLLFQLACEKLRADKIIRPGVTRLERLVVAAREQAHADTFRRLAPLLTAEQCAALDHLLIPEAARGRTPLAWLQHGATRTTPRAIVQELEKLAFLRQLGADQWNLAGLAGLTPNRLKFLAQLGKKATNQALQRTPPTRRYPILLAFLHQAVAEITDESLDLFDRCLAQSDARARHALDEFRRTVARATNEKVLLLRDLGRLILDPAVTDPELRARLYRRLPEARLRAAVAECDRLIRPLDDNYFDFLADRYSYLRQFVPPFLAAFAFQSGQSDDPLLVALALLRQLNATGRRAVPPEAPVAFVSGKWRPYVIEDRGQDRRLSRRYYELCALTELRDALRAGDVWLAGSRRYADPETYLIPRARWPEFRAETCRLLQAPEHGSIRLQQRQAELAESLAQVTRRLSTTLAPPARARGQLRLEANKLVVPPLPGLELPESVRALQQQVTERLPLVDLTDLLIEVDSWTHFSQHFAHAGQREPRTKDVLTHLYAAILAQACNFGLTTMAEIADLSARQLAWCTTWYLREETLRPAVAAIVNYHYRLPLSRQWGGGTLSSSDGQRFPVAVATAQATALPRYFGLGKGLTFYTWTSDQFSQYGTKVIPATVRDATYVLDEILDNETELPLLEHTTDTAGYTDLVFALFDLLGLQFAPRLRDLGDQRLYRLDHPRPDPTVASLFKGTINQDLILRRWDDLLRVAASLKLGWVTASLLVSRLQAFRRQNALTRALQEYGRLVKTLFILRYLESEDYRRRIGLQLNKGEALHALRRFLFFAQTGQLRRRQFEDQANQASCLNLVTNAVVTWNTVYLTAVLEALRAEGQPVAEADLRHLSPARYDHVNPYGKYRFEVDAAFSRHQLRPLRGAPAADP